MSNKPNFLQTYLQQTVIFILYLFCYKTPFFLPGIEINMH